MQKDVVLNTPSKDKQRYDEMPIKDKILLGPIDKYRKYNRFPWKFLFHVIMVVMTTFQVIYICTFASDYAYNARQLWNFMFMTAPNGDVMDVGQHIYLYNIGSLQDFV